VIRYLSGAATESLEAVCFDADIGLLIQPGIALLPGGRGTHAELGAALGTQVFGEALAACNPGIVCDRRPICIYSPTPEEDFGTTKKTCAFYHHPNVQRFDDLDEMVGWLLSE
jgi:hypothetical protein